MPGHQDAHQPDYQPYESWRIHLQRYRLVRWRQRLRGCELHQTKGHCEHGVFQYPNTKVDVGCLCVSHRRSWNAVCQSRERRGVFIRSKLLCVARARDPLGNLQTKSRSNRNGLHSCRWLGRGFGLRKSKLRKIGQTGLILAACENKPCVCLRTIKNVLL